jgi:hypothetical protein
MEVSSSIQDRLREAAPARFVGNDLSSSRAVRQGRRNAASLRHFELKRRPGDALSLEAERRACSIIATCQRDRRARSPHARPLAALAFDDLVALLQETLALAILAFLLLLDVRAFLIGHDDPPGETFAGITMVQSRIGVYKQAQPM